MRSTLAAFSLCLLLAVPTPADSETGGEAESSPVSGTNAVSEPAEGPARPNPLFNAFGAGLFAASAGDLISTEWGLSRPGLYETNPLVENRAVRVTTHALVPIALYYTTKKLDEKGHGKLALWTRIAVTAAYGYAILHNLREVNGVTGGR